MLDTSSKNQILLAVSGKGGTGKTTLAAGVTACLATLGNNTVLLDADIGLRNIDIVLGITDKALLDLGDVLTGNAALEDALIAHPRIPNLSILPAPSGDCTIDTQKFPSVLEQLKETFRYIWIDSPAGLQDWVKTLSTYADQLLVVATPDTSSIRDAAKTTMLLEAPDLQARLIVNRVRPHLMRHKGAMYIDDIMDETGLPLLGLVPEDERVIIAGNKGLPLICLSQDGAALAYRNIALRITGARVPLGKLNVTCRASGDFLRRLSKYI